MEMKNTIPFILTPKGIKYFGLSVMTVHRIRYADDDKMRMKETKDDFHEWRRPRCARGLETQHGTEVSPPQTCLQVWCKASRPFLGDINKRILKFTWKDTRLS